MFCVRSAKEPRPAADRQSSNDSSSVLLQERDVVQAIFEKHRTLHGCELRPLSRSTVLQETDERFTDSAPDVRRCIARSGSTSANHPKSEIGSSPSTHKCIQLEYARSIGSRTITISLAFGSSSAIRRPAPGI